MKKAMLAIGAGLAAIPLAYFVAFRPWHVRWGATDEEVRRRMPGDDEVKDAFLRATRAVTIEARPEEIWPWLVQIGTGRGGFYSYTWVEKGLGLDVKNADRILPEFQDLAVGDRIPLAPGVVEIPVAAIDPPRTMLWVGHDPLIGDAAWVFGLYPIGERRTRLVTRYSIRSPMTRGALLWTALVDPGAFFMTRKMMLGIKERAERLARERASGPAAADERALEVGRLEVRAARLEKELAGLPEHEDVHEVREKLVELRRELAEARTSPEQDWDSVRDDLEDLFEEIVEDLAEARREVATP